MYVLPYDRAGTRERIQHVRDSVNMVCRKPSSVNSNQAALEYS